MRCSGQLMQASREASTRPPVRSIQTPSASFLLSFSVRFSSNCNSNIY